MDFAERKMNMIWKSKIALKKRTAELEELVSSHSFHIKMLTSLISTYKEEIQSLKKEMNIQKGKVAVKDLVISMKTAEINKLYHKIEDLKEELYNQKPQLTPDIDCDHEYPEEWNDTILSSPPCKKCGLLKED